MPQATKTPPRRRAGEDEAILAALSTVAQAVSQVRLHERLLEDAGVRVDRAGAALLTKLRASDDGALRVTTLAERLGVDTPTVTRKVQQLERLGLVVRESDALDRRAIRISLTDAGSETLDRLTAAKRRWLETLLSGWASEDVAALAATLGRFASCLQATVDGVRSA